jgi:hypothetical protein
METVEDFFGRFAQMSNSADTAGLVALFAPQFLVGNAQGTQVLSPSVLAHIIPKRKQITDALGCGRTILRSVVETKFDQKFSAVATAWAWEVTSSGAAPFEVTVASTYIVERIDDRLQIVAYFAHGDVVAEAQRGASFLSRATPHQ